MASYITSLPTLPLLPCVSPSSLPSPLQPAIGRTSTCTSGVLSYLLPVHVVTVHCRFTAVPAPEYMRSSLPLQPDTGRTCAYTSGVA
jgi:hypothetical protein